MNIPNIKTNPGLLEKLRAVAGVAISNDETRAQRTSFIFGQLNGRVPREQIVAQLDAQEGRA